MMHWDLVSIQFNLWAAAFFTTFISWEGGNGLCMHTLWQLGLLNLYIYACIAIIGVRVSQIECVYHCPTLIRSTAAQLQEGYIGFSSYGRKCGKAGKLFVEGKGSLTHQATSAFLEFKFGCANI